MLRLAAIVFTVGLADSLNPSTVGPALYLATGSHRVMRVGALTAGVFAVNLVAGLVLTVGPGRLIVGLLPHPRRAVVHLLELAAGVALVAAAVVLWLARRRLARRALPMRGSSGRSALVAGASIAAIELPTAAPYLALIAAVAASNANLLEIIVLLGLFNLAFVLPLLAILALLLIAGPRADPLLEDCGAWLQRNWPAVFAGVLLLVGGALTVTGASGLMNP